ncbi:MAG: hypothetical protein ACJ77F_13140 [Chloroflexota bacterium]
MVLIVGWGGGVSQDLGEVAPTVCPRCHNDVFLHEIRSNKQISVYFVPIVPYDSNAYLACPICRTGVQLKREQMGAADRMRATTHRFRQHRLDEPAYRVAVGRFLAALGVAPSGAQVLHPAQTIPPPVAGAPVPPAPAPSLADQLAGVAKLHADGLLTDDQFAAAKRRLLDA